jgi:hypothetical protein
MCPAAPPGVFEPVDLSASSPAFPPVTSMQYQSLAEHVVFVWHVQPPAIHAGQLRLVQRG